MLILEQGSNIDRDADVDRRIAPQARPAAAGTDRAGGPDVAGLPLVRVPRLKMEDVSDDDLVQLYRRSILVGADAAARAAGSRSGAPAVARRSDSAGRRLSADDRGRDAIRSGRWR